MVDIWKQTTEMTYFEGKWVKTGRRIALASTRAHFFDDDDIYLVLLNNEDDTMYG